MTLRDAAGLAGLLGCAALLAWPDSPAPVPEVNCRASNPAPQDEAVTDFLFAPASAWRSYALERELDVAMLRSRDAHRAGSRAR